MSLDTYPTERIESMQSSLAALESENKALRDRFSDADTERNAAQAALKAAFARVAEMEAENKHLTQLLEAYRVHADTHRALLDKYDAERNGWLDIVGKASHAIDLFAKLEARCKRLEEARPAEKATPCPHCLRVECECSDFDVAPDMGDK